MYLKCIIWWASLYTYEAITIIKIINISITPKSRKVCILISRNEGASGKRNWLYRREDNRAEVEEQVVNPNIYLSCSSKGLFAFFSFSWPNLYYNFSCDFIVSKWCQNKNDIFLYNIVVFTEKKNVVIEFKVESIHQKYSDILPLQKPVYIFICQCLKISKLCVFSCSPIKGYCLWNQAVQI